YVLALILTAAVGVWAYRVNYDTLAALDRVEALHRDIAREQEAIAILRAEWAWLNRPERLARLVEAHPELGLGPFLPAHFGEVAEIAFQPPPPQKPAPAPGGLPPVLAASLDGLFGRAEVPEGAARRGFYIPLASPRDALRAGRLIADGGPADGAPAPPADPARPHLPAAEAPVTLAALTRGDHVAFGVPLPPPRPLQVAEVRR
ncbi:MAG: hypothetical protein AAFU61_10305, partial [Pseudomonadota bacterium]